MIPSFACMPSSSNLLNSVVLHWSRQRSTRPFTSVRPHLQSLEGVWKGLHPDKKGGYNDGWGVVGTVVALRRQVSYWEKVRWIKITERTVKKNKTKKQAKWGSDIYTIPLHSLHFFISLDEHLSPLLRLSSHWLRQVTESCRIWQIEGLSWREGNPP